MQVRALVTQIRRRDHELSPYFPLHIEIPLLHVRACKSGFMFMIGNGRKKVFVARC